jgi:hypothetical protein
MASVREKAKFDPSKNYEWEPNIEVVLSGREFEALVNAVRAANFIINTVFANGVEEGIIKEVDIKDKQVEVDPIPTKQKDIKKSKSWEEQQMEKIRNEQLKFPNKPHPNKPPKIYGVEPEIVDGVPYRE